jgi:hypothetical protein
MDEFLRATNTFKYMGEDFWGMIEFLGGKTSAVRCSKKPRLRLESNKALGGFFSPGARELERKRERERKREKERERERGERDSFQEEGGGYCLPS